MRRRLVGVAVTAGLVLAGSLTVAVQASAGGLVAETAGGLANTWTNYTNAGGTAGSQIPGGSTVQIACKLPGFRVADGNTWWYRIGSAPWNGAYYVSADAFYNNGATSGSLVGTPFVDPEVPDCGAPPAPAPSVILAQGPAAPAGYRYAITLAGFAANTAVSITCFDSVSTSGFFHPFTLTTDGNGNAFTQSYCFSGDRPEHWVIAGGIASNRVTWGGGSGGGTGSGSGQGTTSPPPQTGPDSVFFSPIGNAASPYTETGHAPYYQGAPTADVDYAPKKWTTGDCGRSFDSSLVAASVTTLSGWSSARLGPIYFLARSGGGNKIQNIILFDPGSTANMTGRGACDSNYDINGLLASWLRASSNHHLLVLTGHDSEEKPFSYFGKASFAGLWKFYFAKIWNQRFASRALVCDYNNLSHYDVLAKFRGVAKFPPDGCPVSASAPSPVAWHP